MKKNIILGPLHVLNKFKKIRGYKSVDSARDKTWVKSTKNMTYKILPSGTNVVYKKTNDSFEKIVVTSDAKIYRAKFASIPQKGARWIGILNFDIGNIIMTSLSRTAPGAEIVKSERCFPERYLHKLTSIVKAMCQ